MSYQAPSWELRRWLETAAGGFQNLLADISTLPRWLLLLLAGGGLAAFAVLLRCLHLLDASRYYLLGPDSYFFHWLAGRIMTGEGPPPDALPGSIYTLHSGLAYPLAYVARALSFVFGLSSSDALDLACKIMPPVLAVISVAVLYWFASKAANRRVALFAAFAWAAMLHAIFIGAAGYVDRDGLSVLLVAVGAFVFFLSKGWQLHVRGRDVGWLVAGGAVLAIEGVLYLEWSIVGPILLLAVLIVYFVLRLLIGYADRLQTVRSTGTRFAAAIGDVNWRTLAVVIGCNALVTAILHNQAAYWFEFALNVAKATGQSTTAEMSGIALGDVLLYRAFLIPMALGLYLVWRRRGEATIFFASWFICLLVLGLFASRVLLYAAPAACLLSGAALSFLWGKMKEGELRLLKMLGVSALLCLLVALSFSAYSIASNRTMAPDNDWQDTLSYLRNETPQDAVVMTWWDFGYWILDLGERKPLVDNGYYSKDIERLHDIGLTYSSIDPAEVAHLMEKNGAEYLVFSTLELEYPDVILWWARINGGGQTNESFPTDSLVVLSLSGEFESGGGLEVVHRSSPDSEVVILSLTDSEQ